MGILNLTPDSFYAGSRIQDDHEIITQAAVMIQEGADILDIGGYSSRPGAEDISVQEEMDRVSQAIEKLSSEFPETFISIDTFRSEVAEQALINGAHIVNDISGGQLDDRMYSVVAKYDAPYILMHMRGTPQNMTEMTDYENLMSSLQMFFSERIQMAKEAGIKDIIIDPGFGFSKNVEQNFELLKNLEIFHIHNCPILVGVSRKSMIYKTLGATADEALNGTTVLNTYGLEKGASIIRVHDVKEARETIDLMMSIHHAG